MSMLTQGTQVYVLVPIVPPPAPGSAPYRVMEVECATAFNPGGAPAGQIDDTCLDETEAQRFLRGLRVPGQATLTIRADSRNTSHVRLFELSQGTEDLILKWAVGWSDGKDVVPVADATEADWDLPATRTWFTFEGYVADFPFDFQGNTTVTSTVTIQRSGPGAWLKKA